MPRFAPAVNHTCFSALVRLALMCAVALALVPQGAGAQAAPRTFYVDCAAGNDTNSGTTTAKAWRTVKRANSATLQPGDQLRFKRGCSWNERLVAAWNGTAAAPIRIHVYGSGSRPRFQVPFDTATVDENVLVKGSYLVIEHLQAVGTPQRRDASCQNQPLGETYGFNFTGGAHHNTLRKAHTSGHMAGIHLAANSHHNTIVQNIVTGNNVMKTLSPTNPAADLGAWGILILSNDNEVASNQLSNNNAVCSYGPKVGGNSIEIYEGQRNSIHHNTAINDRVFSELGGSAAKLATDNTYAYNLVVSSMPYARFLVTRGAGDSRYGPVLRTVAYNNTVYLTGQESEGVICSLGCSADVLALQNNILWAEGKAAYADGAFNESHNLYWSANGVPFVQFQGFSPHATSLLADPRFVQPHTSASGDFRLKADSPALNAGASAPGSGEFATDLAGTGLPVDSATDIGAYERLP